MPVSPEAPLLNPVLSLQMDPRPEPRPGRGKDTSKIVISRLLKQQRDLSGTCHQIFHQRAHYPVHAGKLHLIASMFDDSLSPSHTPWDLFDEDMGCRFVAPYVRGYLIEASVDHLPRLAQRIGEPANIASRVDISRVEELSAFDQQAVLRSRSVEQLWEKAPEVDEGKLFTVWFMPFRDIQARRALLETIDQFSSESVLLPVFPVLRLARPGMMRRRPENSFPLRWPGKAVSLVRSEPTVTLGLHVPQSAFRGATRWRCSSPRAHHTELIPLGRLASRLRQRVSSQVCRCPVL